MITLLLDKLDQPSDIPFVWRTHTNELLRQWESRGDYLQLIEANSFDPNVHDKSFYTVLITSRRDIFMPSQWSIIPAEHVALINKYSLPVLIFYPFEYLETTVTVNDEYIKSFNITFPNSKLVHISLTQITDHCNTPRLAYHHVYFIPSMGFLEPWSRAMTKITRRTEHVTTADYPMVRSKLFLCLNRSERYTRQVIVQKLRSSGLIDYGFVSADFGDAPLKLPDCPATEWAEFNTSWNDDWYRNSWCSIITETENSRQFTVNDKPYFSPLITEKTVKAIQMMHPFYVYGNLGSHHFLRSLGFKTFETSWFGMPEFYSPTTLEEDTTNLLDHLMAMSHLTQSELHVRWKSIEKDLLWNKLLLNSADWGAAQIQSLDAINTKLH